MKKIILLFLLIVVIKAQAQINVLSPDNGSVTILPNGVKSKSPVLPNTNNIGIGDKSLVSSNAVSTNNIGLGINSLRFNNYASGNIAIGTDAMMNINSDEFTALVNSYNTAVGHSSLKQPYVQFNGSLMKVVGNNNSAFGAFALLSNSTGFDNVAAGVNALKNNQNGAGNSAFGTDALSTNSAGAGNVAVGNLALNKYQGSNNTAIGSKSQFENAIGVSNTSVGESSLKNNLGNYNTAVGNIAAFNNKNGASNTAIGESSFYNNKFGNENVAIGNNAMFGNTYASKNIGIGNFALYTQSFANGNVVYESNNVAIGYISQYATQPVNLNNEFFFGFENTSLGNQSLYTNTSGSGNVSIGYNSGENNTTGNYNTFLGTNAKPTTSNISNSTAIGYGAIVNASAKIRLGSSSVTVVEGPVAYTFPSDRRLKENIVYTSLGLDFVKRLKTVSYNYIADKTHVRHDGFIAQEVEDAAKSLSLNFSAVKKSEAGEYSLAYSDFVMPLVNAVKELSEQIELLKATNKNLEARLSSIENSKTEKSSIIKTSK